MSIGISLESDEDGNDRYIYNLFVGAEYVNIAGAGMPGRKIGQELVKEMVDEWNHQIQFAEKT